MGAARRTALAPLALLVAVVVSLLLVTSPALALDAHVYKTSFGSAGSGSGQFLEPSAVAVNEVTIGKTGDVYVADEQNDRVEWFSPEGKELKGQFDGHETPAGVLGSPRAIAIDNSTNPLDPSVGDVYVLDSEDDVIDKFEAGGKYVGSITAGAGGAPFGRLLGVAVDPEGQLWVLQADGEIDGYSPAVANEFLSSRVAAVAPEHGFAVDAEDNFYVTRGDYPGAVAKLDSAGEVLIEEMDPEGSGSSALDTATGEVFIDNFTTVAAFDPTPSCTAAAPCKQPPVSSRLDRFGAGHLENATAVAVDAANDLAYVADAATSSVDVFTPLFVPYVSTGPATALSEESVTLTGTVNPEGVQVTSCQFEYGPTTAYGSTAACSPTPGAGSAPVSVSARITGLTPGATYHYRLIAGNKNGTHFNADETFQAGPSVEGEAISSVGATEAEVSAQIGAAGLTTDYRVEYGTTPAYGSSTAAVSIGAPSEAVTVTVTVRLPGLKPGARYYFRFVASNAFGSTVGPEVTFVTAGENGAAPTLPDHRAYELVSPREDTEVYPPDYHQDDLQTTGEFGGLVKNGGTEQSRGYRAAANGDGLSFVGESPASGVGGSGATGEGDGNEYMSRRGAAGWETTDLELPAGGEEGLPEFEAFSADLSTYTVKAEALVSADPAAPASCVHRENTYSHDATGYHALIAEPLLAGSCFVKGWAGISANDAHSLLSSRSAYTAGAVEAASYEDSNLYDSVGGALHQVNVLPDGEPEQQPHAQYGGVAFYQGSDELGTERTVSSNGSRVFWSALEGEKGNVEPKALYVRENDTQPQSPLSEGRCTVGGDACTLQLDVKQSGAEGSSGGGRFWSASTDGSRVFFTDCSRLTADSTAHSEGGCVHVSESGAHEMVGNDLYEYNLEKPEGERLTDLTVDHTAEPLGADVQGVIGASEDGSDVYFVADGVLTSGPNAEGKEPVAERPNLYRSHEGATTFVTTLAATDDSFQNINPQGGSGEFAGDWHMEPGSRTAEVAPSGNAVAFMSTQPLTGYDSYGISNYYEEKATYAELPEVFVYEAGAGRMFCTSCNPNGQPPVRSSEAWEDESNSWVASSGNVSFAARWINQSGDEIYFMTDQPLVSRDTNNRQDVYEWESDGTGECHESAGCVSPLSSVTTPGPAFLLDASLNGEDVFFTQRASLVPQAIDEDVKIYDARVNGGFPEASQACTGTGCQGVPPASPSYATPASETFNGIGNYPPAVQPAAKAKPKALTRSQKLSKALALCRRKKSKGRRRSCEKQARKLYGPAKKKGKR